MNDQPRAASRKLSALIAEAKNEREPNAVADLDWDAIEARVMKSVAEPVVTKPTELSSRRRALRYGTVALTLAATVIIWARRDAAQKAEQHHETVATSQRQEASSLTSGALRVDDAAIAAGHVIREGDALSIASGRAVLERPHAVSWLMETVDSEAARARVSAAGRPLVLDLEHGAIEAQVVPVSSGEAFAVDVISKTNIVRVAVHGTHLRVARAGDRVIVDLTEGVIAIGIAPASGVTTGITVRAPAHVELDPNDLGSIKVVHSGVRAPIQLGDHVVVVAPPPVDEPATPTTIAAAPTAAPKAPPNVEAPKPVLLGREAIVAAVRDCAAGHATSGEVRVTVTSELALTVGPEGTPAMLKFNPPLPPDVQTCAADKIYKVMLANETGTISVPIQFTY